jgi:hypothetical protein
LPTTSRSGSAPPTDCATADRLDVQIAAAFPLERGGFILAKMSVNVSADATITTTGVGVPIARSGEFFMPTTPDNTDPLPIRLSTHRISTLTIRFIGLLVLAVAVLAFAWSR